MFAITKERGWMATSFARTKSQSNRHATVKIVRRCPCPAIPIENVPALRASPRTAWASLEAVGRLFRAKVILWQKKLWSAMMKRRRSRSRTWNDSGRHLALVESPPCAQGGNIAEVLVAWTNTHDFQH